MNSEANGANKPSGPNFEQVFEEELAKLKELSPESDKSRLVGLALSGGGIRSATFNLGLIQALANQGLLDKFHYLSTVSGGGYIGSWLVSWAKRSKNGMAYVQDALSIKRSTAQDGIQSSFCDKSEPDEVSWLRRYSNYLTPRKGLFSLDTLTGITYHIRNVFLSSLTIGFFVFGLMALFAAITQGIGSLHNNHHIPLAGLASGAGLVMGFAATTWMWFRLPLVADESPSSQGSSSMVEPIYRGYKLAVGSIALLAVSQSVMLGIVGISPFLALVGIDIKHELSGFDYLGGGVLGVGYLCATLIGIRIADWKIKNRSKRINWCWLYISALPGAIPFFVLGGFLHKISSIFGLVTSWELTGISAPLICLLVSFAASVHLGIVGRAISSEAYFWVSRVAGRMAQFSILFALPAVAFLVFPTLLDWSEAKWSIGGAGAIFAIVARWLAASPSTGGANGQRGGWQRKMSERIISAAPFILIPLLIGFAAWGVRDTFIPTEKQIYFGNGLLKEYQYTCQEKTVLSKEAIAGTDSITRERIESGLQGGQLKIASGCIPSLKNYYKLNIEVLNLINTQLTLLSGFIFLILAMGLARLIDANLFSLHSYYRNRLTNAYLAASNKKKDRDVDTGIHPSDAIPLQDLMDIKPYLLVNTALNLAGKNTDLAWQDRKAASFVMSPLYCGYATESISGGRKECFQPTSSFAPSPIKLSLAMTISGAAGSPMGGFHTKPGVSMLLALAGVRLGWWLPNPAKPDAWIGKPDTSLLTTFPKEVSGSADENGNVVYLSDGGHFENLGIYELVRRRCALIVASDASADPDFVFDDLARAIHNIRTDFGVEIEMDISSLRPQKDSAESATKYRFSPSNFVIGKIKYSKSPRSEFKGLPDGNLIYIKSSIPKSAQKDAVDVLYYASTHEDFPHEPTSDQWFSEEQFEAYRKLGLLIGENAAVSIDDLMSKS